MTRIYDATGMRDPLKGVRKAIVYLAVLVSPPCAFIHAVTFVLLMYIVFSTPSAWNSGKLEFIGWGLGFQGVCVLGWWLYIGYKRPPHRRSFLYNAIFWGISAAYNTALVAAGLILFWDVLPHLATSSTRIPMVIIASYFGCMITASIALCQVHAVLHMQDRESLQLSRQIVEEERRRRSKSEVTYIAE